MLFIVPFNGVVGRGCTANAEPYSRTQTIPAMMELAACVQSLGVLISDRHFNRDLTDESADVRDGVELLGDQLSQCLLKANEMIVARQTPNTHAVGALRDAYGRSVRRRNSSSRSGGERPAASAADTADVYVQNLASFMDEVDLAEVLTASLEHKIRRWHAEYCAARVASDAGGGRLSASVVFRRGENGAKMSCEGDGGSDGRGGGEGDGDGEGEEATIESRGGVEAARWKTAMRKATKSLNPNGDDFATGGEGGGGRAAKGEGGSSDFEKLLDLMVLKGLNRGGGATGSVVSREHDAERKVRYLNGFLTTAGIMLGCLRRMTTLLAKLGPGGMTGDALLRKRSVIVSDAGSQSLKALDSSPPGHRRSAPSSK